jgi:hypothetical protein
MHGLQPICGDVRLRAELLQHRLRDLLIGGVVFS